LVPLWFDEPGPDFVIAAPDLLLGLPATPAPLFVLDSANAIDEASIAAITNKGVWRGTAMRDGKSVDVSLDFEGNVVAR
jgi:hypothetical protein